MIIARNLALLANAISITWQDDSKALFQAKFQPGEQGVCINGDRNAVYLLPLTRVKEVPVPAYNADEKKAFQIFTSAPATSAIEINIKKKTLHKIGYAREIEYESDKWTGRKVLYFHEYKKKIPIYADSKKLNKAVSFGLMAIDGSKLMTGRGLIG